MIIVVRTFLGKIQPDRLEKPPHEAPVGMLISPSILIGLVIGIFLFPNVLGQYILQPAMASIYPSFPSVEELTPHISAWHGIKTELLMTIGVVIVGIVLFRTLKKWRPVYQLFSPKYSFNAYYEHVIGFSEGFSSKMTKRYMNGNLTYYFIYIYVFFVIVLAGYSIMANVFVWDPSKDSPIESYELITVFVMIFAALAILFAKSRITIVFLNGVLGYSVAFFFVIFRAPDLALTQLVVESVTTALFLLALNIYRI